jgi:hypothetical protein
MRDGDRRDEFYVGYLPRAPEFVARRVRRVVIVLLLAAALTAVLLAAAQGPFLPSVFEFGTEREFHGTILERPVPALLVHRPGASGGRLAFSTYYLVSRGKHGAGAQVAGLGGKTVALRGSLVYHDGQTMIELAPGPIHAGGGASGPPAAVEDLGVQTVVGEIVDSKCYLGAMNPGRGKTHRSCAARCIAGGIPPLLVARDRLGNAAYLLLVGPDGRSVNAEVKEFIAEPVEISGRVERHAGVLVLRADPATYRRPGS